MQQTVLHPRLNPGHRRAAEALLLVSIALAFADASVVALALPDLRIELGASITGVSGVLIVYALAVALTGLAALGALRRLEPDLLTGTGGALFAIASVAAGLSPSLEALLIARTVQGIGGACLVIGAASVLGPLTGDATSAARRWALAGSIGAVIGPALGGVVTQVLDWRAVFLLQAPIALGAVFAAAIARPEPVRRDAVVARRRPGAAVADLGLAALFGALVGALFLGVILLVAVWGLEPVVAAAVVSALPLGTVGARKLSSRLGSHDNVLAGGLLLGGGLATLALIPGVAPLWATIAFVLSGVGFGLLSSVFGPLAVGDGDGARAACLSSTARHLGLVVGLVLIAPVLAADVATAAEQPPLPATATLLDAPVDGLTKVGIALDIRDELADAPEGEIPDLETVFDEWSSDDPDVADLQSDLDASVRGTVTRSFRASFAISAVLALVAAGVGVAAVARSTSSPGPERRSLALVVLIATVAAVAVGVPSTAAAAGGRATTADPGDPCTAPAATYDGSGFDAAVQRIVLSGLNGAACELGTSRESLVLSLEPRSGVDDIRWERGTIERALRSGVDRAIGDADDRGVLPGWLASTLRTTVRYAPLSWFLERIGVS